MKPELILLRRSLHYLLTISSPKTVQHQHPDKWRNRSKQADGAKEEPKEGERERSFVQEKGKEDEEVPGSRRHWTKGGSTLRARRSRRVKGWGCCCCCCRCRCWDGLRVEGWRGAAVAFTLVLLAPVTGLVANPTECQYHSYNRQNYHYAYEDLRSLPHIAHFGQPSSLQKFATPFPASSSSSLFLTCSGQENRNDKSS
ncbi:unnamed protein product [Victoria cruziana]